MTAEKAVVARLEDHVGAAVGHRIYPIQAPQQAPLPYITYRKISPGFLHTLRRTLRLAGPRIQVDTWHRTYSGAKNLAADVREALDGDLALIIGELDLAEPGSADGPRYRVSQDFSVWIEQEA